MSVLHAAVLRAPRRPRPGSPCHSHDRQSKRRDDRGNDDRRPVSAHPSSPFSLIRDRKRGNLASQHHGR